MRIAHLTSYFHPTFYGSHEAHLTRALAARGHEVVILTSDRMPRWGGAAGLEGERLRVGEEAWEGARVRRFRAGPTVGFVPSLRGVARALREETFDLYLAHEVFSLASFYAARAARREERPFFLVQHGYHGGRRWRYRALFLANLATTGRTVLRACRTAVALTEAAAGFLRSIGLPPGRIRVIPTGVDTSAFEPRAAEPAPGPLRAGYLGRIERGKGVEVLVRAFARAFPGGPETLSFTGEGEELPRLAALAESLGIGARCRFLGRLPHALVPEFLRSLDFLAVPTLHAEPFGIAAVEAAACGLPVLASSIGGLAETVVDGETGFLLPPGDEEAWAKAIRDLAADPQRRCLLGRNARARAERVYAWPRIADAFENLFLAAAAAQAPA
ncbi:MAG TPA: glycosyltransferase family 4 protein [Planctomycetota bacterium]|jgi:glycosyltransferase involved in cell wall biosynthesis|nr:glycosyltransferase family 4 protein [Planctomycetota bacterium]